MNPPSKPTSPPSPAAILLAGAASPDPDRHIRQLILPEIGPAGQDRLRRARVLIAGCGALGTHSAELLARAGVGSLRLVDRDIVEWSNLARQSAFTEEHARAGEPKALALAAHLARIDSGTALDPRPVEIDHRNALELASDIDLIVDGTDNVPARLLINDVVLSRRIPWIYAGVIRTHGAVQAFGPLGAPCLRCELPEPPAAGVVETCDTAGVLGAAVAAVAGQQCALAIRVLVDGGTGSVEGKRVWIDPWRMAWRTSRVLADRDCAACVRRRFEHLEGRHAAAAITLCGRDAIQVRPHAPSGAPADRAAVYENILARLSVLGPVEDRGIFLRARVDGVRVTIFRDGRAIFDGLTDEKRARSLYARFVGA